MTLHAPLDYVPRPGIWPASPPSFAQGAPGAYSEAAANDAFPGCEAVPCEQFDAAFQVRHHLPPCGATQRLALLFFLTLDFYFWCLKTESL